MQLKIESLLKFNQLIQQHALAGLNELYVPQEEFDRLKQHRSLENMEASFKQILINLDIEPCTFVSNASNDPSSSTKHGVEQHIDFSNGKHSISIFNIEGCNFNIESTLKMHKKTGLIFLQDANQEQKKPPHSFTLFSSDVPNNEDELVKILIIGCGHDSLVAQNCDDTHENVITIDAYPSAKPDIVLNIETMLPAKLQLMEALFDVIIIEGANIDINDSVLDFFINNLKIEGILDVNNNVQYTKQELVGLKEWRLVPRC